MKSIKSMAEKSVSSATIGVQVFHHAPGSPPSFRHKLSYLSILESKDISSGKTIWIVFNPIGIDKLTGSELQERFSTLESALNRYREILEYIVDMHISHMKEMYDRKVEE